jgi:hypothetical protein
MKDFSLFDSLPNGVIIFKDSKVIFMSQHILDVLNLTYLSKKNALHILCKTLSVEKETQLFDFFSTHDFFINHDKVIQINHNRDGHYDIFQFTLIFDPIVSHNLVKEKIVIPRKYIDEKVAEYFKLNKLERVQVLTFYKGIPLKNFAKILRVSNEAIELDVDKKHIISLKEKNEITIIYNEKKSSSVIIGEIVDSKNTRFTIQNFYLAKEGMHQRNGVRVKTNGALTILVNAKEFEVYDISAKGISITLQNQEEEKLLKQQRSTTLLIQNEMIEIDLEYLKTVYEDKRILKIIFHMHTTHASKKKIEEYLTSKQNEILREIHQILY